MSGSVAEFLRSLQAGYPDFEALGYPHSAELPAIRWKLQNLRRLIKTDPPKNMPIKQTSCTAYCRNHAPFTKAVSRVKGLALAFGSPRLRDAKCDTVGQMKLVNTLRELDVFPNCTTPWTATEP